MKLKHLEQQLGSVSAFTKPKICYEQYPTSAHIASHMLFTAQEVYEDISSQTVVDLGVGCGMLSIGAFLLDSQYNWGIDIDSEALAQTLENASSWDFEIDLIHDNVVELKNSRLKADTVLMNPPFGTKTQPHVDMRFLEVACHISNHAIYSLHKSSTRPFILKKAEQELGLKAQVIAELRYDIPAMYSFHKKKSVDVQVDLFRFEKI